MSLEIKNLSGGYGKLTVLKDISFTVSDGTLTALVGLNGSGKSTTINHIIGLLQPKQGSIVLNNLLLEQEPVAYKSQLAYIPEQPIVYEELTLKEHLELTIAAYHLDEKLLGKGRKLLNTFRLDDKLTWFPTHFSKGMRQK